jgi:tungstate transport system ATP-binding protein
MSSVKYQLSSVQVLYGNELGVGVDDLTFEAGRLHLLTGPNGSGKSTLLNVMAFLKKPDRGQVLFDDMAVKWEADECALLRKRVTLLHQHPYMFDGTVAENVAFGPAARGVSKDGVQRLVKQSLAMVGLEGFESRNARQLSGGESRRVALARALACQSEVLLLDEPIAHVDRGSAGILESLIASLAAGGMTIVMSSHDERLGAKLGGRVIYLEDGKVERTSERLSASASQHRVGGDCDANS